MGSLVRISSLLWADILVSYALFVMQNYLTQVWHLSFTHAAGILNIWNGIVMLLPLVFLFLRDSCLGNFKVLVISSIAYSLGTGFVTMSVPSVLANPCKQREAKCIGRAQEALFYTGMLLIAMGMGGNCISVRPFVTQNEKHENDVQRRPIYLQMLGLIMVIIVAIAGAIALPYINPWELRFGIPAICTVFATILFLTGLCFWPYNFNDLKGNTPVVPEGNPITNICRVFVASVYKSCLRRRDGSVFHRGEHEDQSFTETRFLGCLEKAAIVQDNQVNNRWTLCSIAEVEQVKTVVRMVPLWLTFIICGVVSSTGNTYFVEQADHLDRHIGKWNVPLPALRMFQDSAKAVIGFVAASMLNKKHRHIKGIAVGMLFSILCCITAAKIELHRLDVVRKHELIDKPDADIPMSIYWLLFQFLLLAGFNAFIEKSIVAFYDDQVSSPGAMKDYLVYLTKGVYGLGFMLGVLLVYVVGKISGKGGKRNWFQFTLNKSRLDRYYWVLTVLSSLNLIVFVVVACCYRKKNSVTEGRQAPEVELRGVEVGDAEEKQYLSMAET